MPIFKPGGSEYKFLYYGIKQLETQIIEIYRANIERETGILRLVKLVRRMQTSV